MAHRGPLREIFGMLCLAVFVPKIEKTIMPPRNTGYIIDADDNEVHNVTITPTVTPPATGFLPSILSYLVMAVSYLGEELLGMLAMYLLMRVINGLLPFFFAIKGLFSSTATFASRIFRSVRASGRVCDGVTSDATRQHTSEDHYDEWFDAAEILDNTLSLATNDQALADLRAESAGKDVQIATLTKAARETSHTIGDLNRQNGRLMGTIRTALDPEGQYTPTTDVVLMANDLTKDLKRVSRKVERQKKALQKAQAHQENGQLAQKDEQIAALSAENTRLNGRVVGLEEGQRQSCQAVEDVKKAAADREKSLRERTLAAETTARQTTFQQREYDVLRDQFTVVADELRKVTQERKEALDAQERLSTEIDTERAKAQQNETTADNEAEAQQQAESLLTTVTGELQLANDRIANFEREALAKNEEVRSAEERARGAEGKVTENVTRITELERSLQEAQNEAEERRKHNERLVLRLEETVEAPEEGKGEPTGTVSNQDLITEINELRLQLDDANTRANEAFESGYQNAMSENPPNDQGEAVTEQNLSDRDQQHGSVTPPEDELRRQNELRDESYQRAVADCEQEAQRLINQAVQKERQEAEERLTAAVGQKEQDVQAFFRQKWTDRETQWTANFNADVENAAAERVNDVRDQLNAAVQRAVRAEHKVENPEGDLKEARDYATTLYNNGQIQWRRAEAAEKRANEAEQKVQQESHRAQAADTEIEKYKKGKASQEDRISNLHRELAAVKSKLRTDLELAEMQSKENDRDRAWALAQEFIHRSYDFQSRRIAGKLLDANGKIEELASLLRKEASTSSQIDFLKILLNAEVDRKSYKELYYLNRQVLVRQCAAVNAKLLVLKNMINASDEPDKGQLLAEIYKPRGDEGALFDDEDPASESESNEDEDEGGGSGGASRPSSRQIRTLPTGPRNRPSQQTEGQDTPLPTNRNTENPLKRKGNLDDTESVDSGKRKDASTMGMRPIAGPFPQPPQFPQQGSSSPEADVDQSEIKSESQADLPSSEGIGEATAPQQQSNDQPHVSPQMPGSSSSSSLQQSSLTNTTPNSWSRTPSQTDQAFQPKPTKIPGPNPSTAEGPTAFTFSAPKDIASAAVNPTPAPPNHNLIFRGLSLLGAAMADKGSAPPGPPPAEDKVLEFESPAVTEGQELDSELSPSDFELPDNTSTLEFLQNMQVIGSDGSAGASRGAVAGGSGDEFLAHTTGDDEEDEDTVWEDVLPRGYRDDDLNDFDFEIDTRTFTGSGDDAQPSTVRALDMTEQNYEEQAAEAEAAMQGIHQDAPKKEDQSQNEELEDNFHVNVDAD